MISQGLNESCSLQDQLARFEQEFRYPLGKHSNFRISHGSDYSLFFRAMGKHNTLFSKNKTGAINASVSIIKRRLLYAHRKLQSYYIADLKIRKQASPFTLYKLLSQGLQEFPNVRESPLYSIVMQGSPSTPDQYSGRLGLPKLTKLSEIAIFRMPVEPSIQKTKGTLISTIPDLQMNGITTSCHGSALRSQQKLRSLTLEDKSATCLLEDTRRAKKLFDQNDKEIISGHLSSLRYKTPNRAIELIRRLTEQDLAYPAFFFSVPIQDVEKFSKSLPQASLSLASIYGRQLPMNQAWYINTAEI